MKFNLLIVMVAIFMVSCKSNNGAVKYNNLVVEQQNKLKAAMDENEPKLKGYFSSFEYDSITAISTRMEAQVNSIIETLQKEPAPKAEQGENFKKAVLNYFDYVKSVYDSYKNYGTQTEAQGRMYASMDITRMLSHENKVFDDMLEAQKIFAKDNKFKIREAKATTDNSVVKK